MKGRNWTIIKSNVGGHCRALPLPKQTLRFRLLDDDQEIYFEGVMLQTDTEQLFEPLDEFGVDYGCVEIQILDKGLWEVV